VAAPPGAISELRETASAAADPDAGPAALDRGFDGRLAADGVVHAEPGVGADSGLSVFERLSGRPGIAGDVRLLKDFPSRIMGNSRSVAVYLPPGYESSGRRYPVLYMHDGQNLFDPSTAFGGVEWRMDETLERLIRSGELPGVIVVGVYNTSDRDSEYTPVPDPEYGGGRGDLYGEFLVSELKPFVDASLRTLPDAEHTAVMGSSLGGLISLHLGLTRPDVFSKVAAISPSLWWSEREMLRRLKNNRFPKPKPRIWADMGTLEGGGPEEARQAVEDLKQLGRSLRSRGWSKGRDLAVLEVEGGRHNERDWGLRAAAILKFLFGV
jgi:predicted alpha/beta superfamily hydrolase